MLLPCVSSLPQLTRLALVDVAAGSLAKLRFLPTQLRELQLSLARLKRNENPPPGESRLILFVSVFLMLYRDGCLSHFLSNVAGRGSSHRHD
jgi:hypothetical protein